MDSLKINEYESAFEFLKLHNFLKESDLIQIENDLQTILENNRSFEDAKPHVNVYCKDYADMILMNSIQDGKDFHDLVHICTECVIMNTIHEEMFQLVSEYAKKDDEKFSTHCYEFCYLDVTAEQFGAPENYAIPLIAAIVELASLDNKKSPLDKLNCFCTAYDLVFAELKSALIDVISKTSDSSIPVIENSHIIPILMTVLVKTKPVHIYSNLLLIEHFCNAIKFDRDLRNIFLIFKAAVEKLSTFDKNTLNPKSEKQCRDLDLHKLIIISGNRTSMNASNNYHYSSGVDAECDDDDDFEDEDDREKLTTLDLQTQRIIDLVTASTLKSNNK